MLSCVSPGSAWTVESSKRKALAQILKTMAGSGNPNPRRVCLLRHKALPASGVDFKEFASLYLGAYCGVGRGAAQAAPHRTGLASPPPTGGATYRATDAA